METKLIHFSNKPLSATIIAAFTSLVAVFPLPVKAITFITDRTALKSNDQVDWSSLGAANPFNFLPNSFSAKSERGLGLSVDIPKLNLPGLTPPFVFQTLPSPGIATNFAKGDFVLFGGLILGSFPAPGNPGPITINFDKPVKSVGTQIAVDDTLEFTASISAFDNANNLLGTFSAPGTSSLALDNSALFLGVLSDTPNISRLVFSTSVANRGLAINTLSIAAVPEPTFICGLLVFGVLGGSLIKKDKTNKTV
ncbi:hypothetical protein [Tolypothrix sp. VBCCA 56010]|uniref:hypothetical protein n=1 Tax=Tolypothrix sp. VBCCA 56010 TaxID=3137731 RepID=UPI003D7D9278